MKPEEVATSFTGAKPGQSVVQIVKLGAGRAEVGRARRELARSLHGWGVARDCADTAMLLTTELVTNAIRHGTAPVTVRAGMQASSGRLQVEVHDCSVIAVAPRRAAPGDTDGRGLQLVDVLAESWGSRSRSGSAKPGKNVWFQLSTLPAAG